MPNFKIFQDNPDYARIKVFGNNNVAVNTDISGNLGITSTGLAITAPANGLTVTAAADGLAITPPSNGLMITSTGLAITAPANGLTVTAAADGLAITPPTSGLLITSTGLAVTGTISTTLATTDVSTVRANFTNTSSSPDEAYNVLGIATWTFGVVNSSTVDDAQALVSLQISPDGQNWTDDMSNVTINQNSLQTFVATTFLKYARLSYAAVSAGSAVTLNIFFQGQS